MFTLDHKGSIQTISNPLFHKFNKQNRITVITFDTNQSVGKHYRSFDRIQQDHIKDATF